MINYEKLRLAEKLCEQSGYSFVYFFGGKDVYKSFGRELIPSHFSLYGLDSGSHIDDFDTIGDLIDKIKELTQRQPKYKIGQTAHFIDYSSNKFEPNINIRTMAIGNIDYDSDSIRYVFHGDFCWEIKEEDVYLSRKALMESQIDYWKNLLAEELEQDLSPYYSPPFEGDIKSFNQSWDKLKIVEKCEHKDDGYSYITQHRPQIHSKKCRKCGEFYK